MGKKIEKTFKKIADEIEKRYKIFFVLILLLALFLNFYKLGEVPRGIHVDEAGMAYDAYNIANYGVDRFANHLPPYFIGFGAIQSAFYTYLTAILIKIVGSFDIVIIRLPQLILSIFEVIVAFLLVKEFKSKKHALLFMLLVTVSPWHIMKSRWALDCFSLSPMFLFSIYSLVKAIKGKKLWKYAVSGIIFGLTLYTYALSYIIIPAFLLLMLIYLLINKKVNIKQIISFTIPLIALAIPLLIMIMVQFGWIDEIQGIISIPKMHINRFGEIDISNFLKNMKSLKFVFFDSLMPYNGINGYYSLYPIGLILMILGIIIVLVKEIKKTKDEKDIDLNTIMLFAFISNLILSIITTLNVNKANGIYISATYFILIAITFIYKHSKTLVATILAIYIILTINFTKDYFINFSKNNYPYFDNGTVNMFKYIKEKNLGNRKIYTSIRNNQAYIYDLFINPISPYEFNNTVLFLEIPTGKTVIGYKDCITEIDFDNLEDDAIYVVIKEEEAEIIEEKGFVKEKYNNFYILYK